MVVGFLLVLAGLLTVFGFSVDEGDRTGGAVGWSLVLAGAPRGLALSASASSSVLIDA